MDVRNEIKGYIANSGMTMAEIVEELNHRKGESLSLANLSNKLRRGTIKYSECKDIADVIGMEIIWKRKAE